MDEKYEAYLESKYEARACGDFDFPSFEAWRGESDAKDAAMNRAQSRWDDDEYDLY
tara:strand:+ start:1771 stop:1938 length:168 start_codon:yes stop_codon:yes gene_type:complete